MKKQKTFTMCYLSVSLFIITMICSVCMTCAVKRWEVTIETKLTICCSTSHQAVRKEQTVYNVTASLLRFKGSWWHRIDTRCVLRQVCDLQSFLVPALKVFCYPWLGAHLLEEASLASELHSASIFLFYFNSQTILVLNKANYIC